MRILDNARIERAEPRRRGVRVVFTKDGQSISLDGTHLLLATGRHPSIDFLNLEAAGISTTAAASSSIPDSRARTGGSMPSATSSTARDSPTFRNYHAGWSSGTLCSGCRAADH